MIVAVSNSFSVFEKKVRDIKDIEDILAAIKGGRSRYTNFFVSNENILAGIEENSLNLIYSARSLFVLRQREKFTHVYFITYDLDDFFVLLQKLIHRHVTSYVADVFYNGNIQPEIIKIFNAVGFKIRSTHRRFWLKDKTYIGKNDNCYRVLEAQERDASGIYEIFYSNFDEYSDRLPTIKEIKQAVQSNDVGIALLKQYRINAVDAVVWLEKRGHTVLIKYYVISPMLRGKGIAKRMLCQVLKKYLSERVIIWVRDNNHSPVIAILKKLGFILDNTNDSTLTFIKHTALLNESN